MRNTLPILILTLLLLTCSQIENKKYGGQFSWAGPVEGSPWGDLIVYPNTDSTFLFYIRSSSGETDQLDIITGQALRIEDNKFEFFNTDKDLNCKILFTYNDDYDYFSIKTYSDFNNCNGLTLNNLNENFMRESNKIPDYYTIGTKKLYFKDMKIK